MLTGGGEQLSLISPIESGILAKMLTANDVVSLVNEELVRITDAPLLARTRELLVVPYPVGRGWDYGRIGERFTCWTVLEHPPSNTGILWARMEHLRHWRGMPRLPPAMDFVAMPLL